MRGLQSFIKDLRNCKSKEEESKRINKELANIRNKFNGNKTLDGYQKKKYICKLVYIFLQGSKFEFGLNEAVNLLSSNSYSEKQAGYLFISVASDNKCNFMPLIINVVKIDLSSSNSIFQNLALQFIANSTLVELADALADSVVKLLLSDHVENFVKQSTVLVLLQFLRMKSDLVLSELEVNIVINLISHHNLGLATASASLIEFLVKKYPSQHESCVRQYIVRLDRIVSCSCIDLPHYSYYCVTAPWMTVKLLRILQNFPAPSNRSLKIRLTDTLEMILKTANDNSKAKFEYYNAKYAVILEAISLIIQMGFGEPIFTRAFNTLAAILNHKKTNLRYTTLEFMIRLTSNEFYLENLKSQWRAILQFLKSESDIAIKNQAVDLLYILCSECNVKPIVNEMLHLLECEYSEDVCLRIAALAEQFIVDQQWYFDTLLNLLQMCGDKINNIVWHSLIDVIVVNDSIQEYAARKFYAALCEKNCNDTVMKAASYILGEFGYLIARDPRSSYTLQFSMLKEKYPKCSIPAKALFLTTFMKLLNIYSDLKNEVQLLLKDNLRNENTEIQQRAVEFLKLSEIASDTLLATVFEEMPSSIRKVPATISVIERKCISKTQ